MTEEFEYFIKSENVGDVEDNSHQYVIMRFPYRGCIISITTKHDEPEMMAIDPQGVNLLCAYDMSGYGLQKLIERIDHDVDQGMTMPKSNHPSKWADMRQQFMGAVDKVVARPDIQSLLREQGSLEQKNRDRHPNADDLEAAKITRGEVLAMTAENDGGYTIRKPWLWWHPAHRHEFWLLWHGFSRIDWKLRVWMTPTGHKALDFARVRAEAEEAAAKK